MGNAKLYNYSNDINWDNCKHERKKVFSIESNWEIDSVSIELECEECHKIGNINGRLLYSEEEIHWADEVEGNEPDGQPPEVTL